MKNKRMIVFLLAVMLVVAAGCVLGPVEQVNTPAPCAAIPPHHCPPNRSADGGFPTDHLCRANRIGA